MPEIVPEPDRPQRQVVVCGRCGHRCGWGPAEFVAIANCPQLARPAAAAAPLALHAVLVVDRLPRRPLPAGSPSPRFSASCFVELVVARARYIHRQAPPFELEVREGGGGWGLVAIFGFADL